MVNNPYVSKSYVAKPKAPKIAPEDVVPAGTVAEILAWVGSDSDRAQKALEAEQSGHKRKSLTSKLEEIVEA